MNVFHHTKYLETDGSDEIIEVSQSEHKKLHVNKHVSKSISVAAHNRLIRRISLTVNVGNGAFVKQEILYNTINGKVSFAEQNKFYFLGKKWR